jgi:hypothetical protein
MIQLFCLLTQLLCLLTQFCLSTHFFFLPTSCSVYLPSCSFYWPSCSVYWPSCYFSQLMFTNTVILLTTLVVFFTDPEVFMSQVFCFVTILCSPAQSSLCRSGCSICWPSYFDNSHPAVLFTNHIVFVHQPLVRLAGPLFFTPEETIVWKLLMNLPHQFRRPC